MENELISIIVAVYNTEEYLKECIDSVRAQSYQNWELFLINDGSTDQSEKICKEYSFDSRIKIYSQENKGQSAARNRALKECSGEYLMFLDSDDKLAPNAIEKLYLSIKESNADICFGNIKMFSEKKEHNLYDIKERKFLSGKEACKKMFVRQDLDSNTFAKIYKSYLWKEIFFPEGSIFEDVPIMYKIFLKCNLVIQEPFCVYEQRMRAGSTTRIDFSEKRKIYVEYAKKVLEDISMYYSEMQEEAKVYYLTAVMDNFIHVCCSRFNPQYEQYKNELFEIIKSNQEIIRKYECLRKMKKRVFICQMGLGKIAYQLYQRIK